MTVPGGRLPDRSLSQPESSVGKARSLVFDRPRYVILTSSRSVVPWCRNAVSAPTARWMASGSYRSMFRGLSLAKAPSRKTTMRLTPCRAWRPPLAKARRSAVATHSPMRSSRPSPTRSSGPTATVAIAYVRQLPSTVATADTLPGTWPSYEPAMATWRPTSAVPSSMSSKEELEAPARTSCATPPNLPLTFSATPRAAVRRSAGRCLGLRRFTPRVSRVTCEVGTPSSRSPQALKQP
mmetsp:Transcript_7283/g.21500  ORF Transcript_7283/g.21500 Transcript_7283/m.21500 type:complete len:238 (-) Transcript_7283:1736-2449(-)